ncbi:MAG TPA: methylated-DNA--[protein]-cysteine S-methyltransferase [Phycisphaerae bacterium]|nr:methylated-DNA--[protein]-cysteine S-methyltransferase [Phycisphaerae bacterium]HNU46449.1 methylated-DNA--[protein]-cysteine S-methyltransferase [Phycisphaerae bacterium]
MWYSVIDTAWGPFTFVATGERLLATYLPGDAGGVRQITRRWAGVEFRRDGLTAFRETVKRYFAGKPVTFDGDVDWPTQSAFARHIVRACRKIPYGSTISYGELAQRSGYPGAARAVGNVMARNPLPLVVPCHRVVRADGSLGGFSGPGGVCLKERLLELEGHARPAGR